MLPRPPRRPPLGAQGEDAAARALESRGLEILARNHRTRLGEIDLVVRDGDALVAVEVKARTVESLDVPPATGLPAEAVTPQRLMRLSRALESFARSRGESSAPLRIDVVEILADRGGRILRLSVLRDVTA